MGFWVVVRRCVAAVGRWTGWLVGWLVGWLLGCLVAWFGCLACVAFAVFFRELVFTYVSLL